MDNVKISELPSASQLNDEDLLVIVQGDTTKNITAEKVKDKFGGSVTLYTDFGYNEDGSVTQKFFTEEVEKKQDELVSGVNIKTINGNDITGAGNVEISGDPELITTEEFNNKWEDA